MLLLLLQLLPLLSVVCCGADETPLFVAISPVPEGFEQLAEPYTTMVDVFYGSRLLESQLAVVYPGALQLSSPESIVDRLPDLKDKARVLAALSGKVPSHAHRLCSGRNGLPGETPECGVLYPDVAGIIYDERSFRATVFIAPGQLKLQRPVRNIYLPAATESGIGLMQLLSANVSGSSARSENNSSLSGYTLTSLQDKSLTAEWDIASREGARIASFYLGRDRNGFELRGGCLGTSGFGFSFTPDRRILGLHIGLSERTRTDLAAERTTPVHVFVPVRARVEILREGVLLRSWLLDVGNHELDTSGLPTGSYPIQVRILDDGGQILSDSSRFYVSQPALPPVNTPLWFAELGRVVDWRRRSLWPGILEHWLGRAGISKRLGNNLGSSLAIAASNRNGLIEAGLIYMADRLELSPGGLISARRDYGIRLDARLQLAEVQGALGFRKLHLAGGQPPDPVLLGRNQGSLYVSLATSLLEGQLHYRVHRLSGSGRAARNSHSLSYNRVLLRDSHYELSLRFEGNRTGSNTLLLAGLEIRLRQERLRHQLSPRYQYQAPGKSGGPGGSGGAGESGSNRPQHSGYLRYNLSGNHRLISGEMLHTGVWAEAGREMRGIGCSAQISSRLGHISAGLDHARTGSRSFSSWVLGAATGLVWSGSHLAAGGEYAGHSALVVRVDGSRDDAVFDILVNGKRHGYTRGAAATVIPLAPFATYTVSVVAADDGIYDYQEEERTITLYPGNVSLQVFSVQAVRLIIGQLQNRAGQPVAGALITGAHRDASHARLLPARLLNVQTDAAGLFQIELPEGEDQLIVTDVQQRSITLPLPPPSSASTVENIGVLVIDLSAPAPASTPIMPCREAGCML